MNSIVIPEITREHVRRVVKSLKCIVPGWDGLPASIGKQCIDSYIKPLTILINVSFAQGIFPDELKLARVVPIYKSGDEKEMGNYRPIFVLSFYSKIFENIEFLAPTHPLFERLNILKFDNLVIQRISLLMYKLSIPSPISLLCRTNITYHEHNTRRARCLHSPIGRSEAIYKTFNYRGVHIRNYISLKVNTDVLYACFKKLVRHHLQSNRTPLIRLNV